MGAFQFVLGDDAAGAALGRAAVGGVLVNAFRPSAREVTVEGPDLALDDLVADAPSRTVVRRKSLAEGRVLVELHPDVESTWPLLMTACQRPVRVEVRGNQGRDRTLLVIADSGTSIVGFVDDPGMLMAVEAELRSWGSFSPRLVPRDEGGFGEKRLALVVGASSVWPLGALAAEADRDGVTAGMLIAAVAFMAVSLTIAWLIWRHAMRRHGGTWHGN